MHENMLVHAFCDIKNLVLVSCDGKEDVVPNKNSRPQLETSSVASIPFACSQRTKHILKNVNFSQTSD
jgi:hypothetical protein